MAFASFGSYDRSGYNVFKKHWLSSFFFFFEMTLHRGDRFCIKIAADLSADTGEHVKENYNKLTQQYIRTEREEQSNSI